MNRPILAAALLLASLAPAGSAQADPFRPSAQDQVQLGQRVAAQIRRELKVLPADDPWVKLVRRVGDRLLSTIDDGDKPWEYSLDVIDSPDINAFSLPGGPTFVYMGLLKKLTSEDELAGVLGHELTHVRKEHWSRLYAGEQKRDLVINLVLILARANNNIASLAQIGDDVFFSLKYSRQAESEADFGGFQMMTGAGYNPQGMVELFHMFETAPGEKEPEFVSDHPSDEKRAQRIEQLAKDSGKTYPPERPIKLEH